MGDATQSTIKVTKRTERSVFMFLLQHMIKPFSTKLIQPSTIYPAGSPKLDPPNKAKKHCNVHERLIEDVYVYELEPKQRVVPASEEKGKASRKRVYYFCGGAWQMTASSQHWSICVEMARKLPDTIVSIVSYPLAPNSPAPVSIPMLMRLYKRLLRDAEDAGERVILAGDSAGGNIILCLTLATLAENENGPHPTALMAISASSDLREENPEMLEVEKHDPILRMSFIGNNAKLWSGEWNAADPRISPLLADVSGLARRGIKVHGVIGRYDILSPDAVLFREKCAKAGVEGEWLDWDKQMHVFPLTWTYGLSEGVAAKDWILDVLRRS